MPVYIVKLTDDRDGKSYYLEWSTVVDAPVTNGRTLEEFERYYRERYGRQGLDNFNERMQRVEQTGASAVGQTLADVIGWNRAGPREKSIGLHELIDQYCRGGQQ